MDVEAEIKKLAFYDTLTGLQNKREFEKRIKYCLKDSRENNVQHIVACFDLLVVTHGRQITHYWLAELLISCWLHCPPPPNRLSTIHLI